MEETLEEIRAQPEQEQLRRAFNEKAHDLTLEEVRLLKKGDTILLIEWNRLDRAHPFRSLEYKHDYLDEVTKEYLAFADCPVQALRAHGFRHLDSGEQERALDEKVRAAIKASQERNPLLEEEEEWTPYSFLVGGSESQTAGGCMVKCWCNCSKARPVAGAQADKSVSGSGT